MSKQTLIKNCVAVIIIVVVVVVLAVLAAVYHHVNIAVFWIKLSLGPLQAPVAAVLLI
jgi:hypothetical protein